MDLNDLLIGDKNPPEAGTKTTVTIESVPTKESIPTVVRVSKEEASKFQVGDSISLNLEGQVKAVRDASMNDEANKFVDVELAGPTISSVAMNAADYEMKRMGN